MPGVLFEGGSFRAIFSCGVMDALLDQDVMFPYCIGVSAGAADSASYISRQKERNLNMLLRYRNDKRYMGLRNYFKKEHSLFGVDFDFEYVFAENRDQYTDLVRRTRIKLNEEGYLVTVTLAPKTSADQKGLLYQGHDYRGMGQAANFVLLMTYEWGYTYAQHSSKCFYR